MERYTLRYDGGGNWHGSGSMSNVIAWKPIKPWMG